VAASNYFGPGVDARRYAQARPPIHRSAVEAFGRSARIEKPFGRALDVGSGTGQSAVALALIADSVVGVDPSTEILAQTASSPKIHYLQATAERLPFVDGAFDLIAAGLAFHWFNAGAFLAEARRLLKPSARLVVYTSGFTGEMLEDPAFAAWFREDFLTRYPTPARNKVPINPSLAEAHGLAWVGERAFSNDIKMSLQRFIDYELSTTNIIAAADGGSAGFVDAEIWMHESLGP
jgi:SAM-dependent methyltransferase